MVMVSNHKHNRKPTKMCHQIFHQEYRKLVVPCTLFFNKDSTICILHCVQIYISWWHMVAKMIAINIVRPSHETKAVWNNAVMFSRCCHKEIHQWLHMPLSLLDLGHLGVFCLVLIGRFKFLLLSSWLNKNVGITVISVMHMFSYCEYKWFLIYFLLLILLFLTVSVLFAIIRGKQVWVCWCTITVLVIVLLILQ